MNTRLTHADYRGYHITHTDDQEDYNVYPPASKVPSVTCESYNAAVEWIDSQLDEVV